MVDKIEFGKKIIIQIIIIVCIAWIISLVVSELFNIKLKNFKLPNVFQPNIIVKIYKDNKELNSYKVKKGEDIEGFKSGKKKFKQRVKNPFGEKKNKKIEKFKESDDLIEGFNSKVYNCDVGKHFSNLYKNGMKVLDNGVKTDFQPYNNEDSGYTQTFIGNKKDIKK
tara:strand:+ start:2281 stop:2781 length:501 start_codon:yes stop_codon:yes gene_type:complete